MSTTVLEKPGQMKIAANGAEKKLYRRPVRYPESDGKPMAETAMHRDAMAYAIWGGESIFRGRADVWVSGNDFIYYAEGEPSKRVSPDCYIVLGVEQKARRSYKIWEENGLVPNVVFEFTSRKTAKEDCKKKFHLYEQVLKIPEYFLFDPLGEYLKPRLHGNRLVNGSYLPIPFDATGQLESQETGIKMFEDGILLRFVDPRTDEVIPTYSEQDDILKQLEQEKVRLRRLADADAEITRLRAEIARLRGGGAS